MIVSKNLDDILRALDKIKAENRRTGTTPPWKIEARNGGFLTDYLHEYRREHRAELNEYQRQYRAEHPEETREQWRRDSARYKKNHKETVNAYAREYRKKQKNDG